MRSCPTESKMSIPYVHALNRHTREGPKAALAVLFADKIPASLLDVGCGTGTWLQAAADKGVADYMGVDGVQAPADQLLIPPDRFRVQDFTQPWDLGRRFEAALCLEVAEHLDESHAGTLIDTLTRHSDFIVFSAACPGQHGQHHVNCQWPAYWQNLFNQRGYACDDAVRWKIWNEQTVEPWYRQNLFVARRAPSEAGQESRLCAVLHPEILEGMQLLLANRVRDEYAERIEQGQMSLGWYLGLPLWAVWAKIRRKLGGSKQQGADSE
jgi:hypothetical protein